MASTHFRSTSRWRWPVLFLSSLVLTGSYYCLDIPAALKEQLDNYFNYPEGYETLFSMLYSLYATPNVILPFFGGYFVDRYGVSKCLLVFSALLAIGQSIVVFGLYMQSWQIIFLGRFVFGLGGENLSVTTSVQVSEWFLGGELAFAFGVNLSVAKLASVANDFLSPLIAEHFDGATATSQNILKSDDSGSSGVLYAAAFGALLCLLSFLSVFEYIRIENLVDSACAYGPVGGESARLEEIKGSAVVYGTVKNDEPSKEENPEMIEIFKFPLILWMLFLSCFVVYGCTLPFNNISASLLLERDFFVVPPHGCALKNSFQCQSGSNKPNSFCPSSEWVQPPLPEGSPSHALHTPCGNITRQLTLEDIDCTDKCWSHGCAKQFCKSLTDSEAHAAMVMSIPYALSAVLIPLLGLVVDKFGGRALLVSVSSFILVAVHSTLGYTHVGPVVPLVGQGVAYAMFVTVFWPAVPMVIETRLTGLAFGVAVSVQNAGCALMPYLASIIYTDSNDRYIPHVEELFMSLGAMGFLISLVINYQDYCHHESILNRAEVWKPEQVVDDAL